MTDALGNELVLGAKYGYSSRDGGWVNTGVGTLESIGEKRVTLHMTEQRSFLYGEICDRSWSTKPIVTVQSCILFPLT